MADKESEVGEMDNKQDKKIGKRIQFDYKLAIETEIIICKGKIKELESENCNYKEKIKEFKKKIRENKKRIEINTGRLSGLQSANYFFDEYKKEKR